MQAKIRLTIGGLWLALLLAAVLPAACGGGGGNDDDDDTSANDDDDITSEVIGNEGGSLAAENAQLEVPPSAIAEGGSATYSIEPVEAVPEDLPEEAAPAGPGARYTPEGIVFDTPVAVELAVPELNPEEDSVALMRYDGVNWEYLGGEMTDQGVRGYTTEFSLYFPVFTSTAWRDNTANVKFVNSHLSQWVNVCIQNYTLANPSQYPNTISPNWGTPVAPVGTIGWLNEIGNSVPAGTYQFQYEINQGGQLLGCVKDAPTVELSPAPYNNPHRIPVPNGGTMLTGMPCDCFQTPTPPIGEGSLQFTLSWSPSNADIDLHVFSPLGDEIYFGNRLGISGGQLDIDDICVNGGPENIFWTSTPPSGEYIVKVVYFSSCGANAVSYSVRANAGGNIVRTVTGTLNGADEEREVFRYTH